MDTKIKSYLIFNTDRRKRRRRANPTQNKTKTIAGKKGLSDSLLIFWEVEQLQQGLVKKRFLCTQKEPFHFRTIQRAISFQNKASQGTVKNMYH